MSAEMMGFYLVKGVINLINSQLAREATERLEDKRQEFQKWQQLSNQEFQREQFEKQRQLQKELAEHNRQTQLTVARHQRETALQSVQKQKLFQNWPLRIVPEQILNIKDDEKDDEKLIPLRIIPVPPVIDFDQFSGNNKSFSNFETDLSQRLREFFNQHYSFQSTERPIQFIAGAWDSKRYHGESAILALFALLKSEPMLILESQIDGEYLHVNVGYWGEGQEKYFYQSIISHLPYREIIYESVKLRARQWPEKREEIAKQLNKSSEEIEKQYGGDNLFNLKILQEEESLKNAGIDLRDLPIQPYKVTAKDFEYLCQFLVKCQSLVGGWVADIHYLVHHNVPPILPKLLPDLIKDINDPKLLNTIISGYRQVYQALENERPAWIPESALDLANSLKYLPDKSWAKEQVKSSIQSWLRVRGVTPPEGMEEAISAMKSVISWKDEEYYIALQECLREVGESLAASQVKRLPILKSLKSATTGVDYTKLRDLLAAGKWKEADQETAKVMLQAANRVSGKWLSESDIDNVPCEDLRTIDQLWVHYSHGKFGFSVQKKIYMDELGGTREYNQKIWYEFCDRVGWRKGGDYVRYQDMTFELLDTTPVAHLPFSIRVSYSWDCNGPVRGKGCVFWVSSLAQRLVTCSISPLQTNVKS